MMLTPCMILHMMAFGRNIYILSRHMSNFSYFTILMNYKKTHLLRALKIRGSIELY